MLVILLASGPAARGQQQDFSKVTLKTTAVATGLYSLEGSGGNIGVSVGKDAVFLIDDQFAPLTEKVKAAVADIDPRPIRFLMNTHWHGDHTGGNENLAKIGVLIFAHDNVRRRLSSPQFIEFLKKEIPAAPEAALPVVTFSETITFHINGDDVEAAHVPSAHTDGDSIIHFQKANVYHTGDIFSSGGYPFIDVSSGGSMEGMIAACDGLLARVDEKTRLIPGHGPVSDRATLETYRKMLGGIRDRIQTLLGEGKTVQQIVEAHPTQEFDGRWAKSFLNGEQFTRIVCDSLAHKAGSLPPPSGH